MKERDVRKIMERFVRQDKADTLFIDMDERTDNVVHAEILKENAVIWRYPEGSRRVMPDSSKDIRKGFSLIRKDYEIGSLEKDMVV